jgi:hypothetical protein
MSTIESQPLAALIVGVACVLTTSWLRAAPRLRCPDFGIDTWYFLTYARALRQRRSWPVTLPYYLLDHPEQAYPPVLPWLLSWWPTRWLERSHWWFNAMIDALHCAMLCGLVWFISRSWMAVGVAGVLFASSPVLIAQATDLNARPIAGMLFSCFMISLWGFERGAGWASGGAVLLTGISILWTHKMTTQQIAAALLAWSAMDRDPRYLLLGAGMVGASLLLSRGWFLNVLRSHAEIVRFWRKHRPFLGRHQVYDSPLYANPAQARERGGVAGVRASWLHRWLAVAHLGLIAALIFWMALESHFPAVSLPAFSLRWTLLVFATVAATTWIPGLRQFGEGFKYLRYGVFPWSFLLALWGTGQEGVLSWGTLGLLLCVQLLVAGRIIAAQRHNYLASMDDDVRTALQELARQPEDGVLALPFSRCEAIAYFCQKRVLWGGHGRGWERLEPFWPVLRKPLEQFFDEYRLHWLWADARYVDIEDLKLPPATLEPWLRRGPIQLFRYRPNGRATAAAASQALSGVA